MNFFFIFLSLVITLFSCKKETTTPNNTYTNTSTSTDPSITSFDCSGVKISGTLKKGEVANKVNATINYSGGNGKTYITKTHASTEVIGLTATLQAGTLANGEGVLTYSITGTATTAGNASFAISLGGKTCLINVLVDNVVIQQGPTITDIDNNTYKTSIIGTQQWMAENLKVSNYNDGSAIPNITDNSQWQNNTTGAWAYYNNDAANNAKYGKLYNWYAVSPTTNGNKNLCPKGWHIPTKGEWSVLVDFLGGGYGSGGKMKEIGTINWKAPNNGATNTSLFTALPGGIRFNGVCLDIGNYGFWWSSSSENTQAALYHRLTRENGDVNMSYVDNVSGLSIRCLKD